MNLAHHLVRAGLFRGDCPAVALGTSVVRHYRELASRASRIAGALRGTLGLEPGDRVALTLRNCPEYLELIYGCWHAGLVAVPINRKLHPNEFAYMFEHSGARVGFATRELTEAAAGTGVLQRLIEVGSAEYEGLLCAPELAVETRAPDDPAWLFYTSGTTGRPKGATLTHRNLLAMSFCYVADVDPGSPWGAILHAAPMSHGSGLYAIPNVIQGACHVIPESGGFDAAEIYELIRTYPDISFFAAPTMVKRLLDHPGDEDTRNLKTIMYGGGPMYVEDSRAALERFGPRLAQLYGQGESPMTITSLGRSVHADRDHPRWLARLASVGVAQSVVEVRVADDKDRTLPVGEIGEVLVRGDSVMRGYWKDPDATAQTLRNGWLHTGDVGTLDDDGFLTLKDRSKDVIISGGTNIYPREVEEVLVRHPGIAEVSVIGREDREWGEVVVAYVVRRGNDAPDAGELDTFCLERMARFKRPRHYRFIARLPKNEYGKVPKTALRELEASRHRAGADSTRLE